MRPTLPPAHMDVLLLLVAGATNPEIAEKLNVSVDAVKSRIRTFTKILGATTRTEAVAVAFRAGILGGPRVDLPHLQARGVPLQALVEAREDRGLSQAALGAQLGRSASWLSYRETGVRLFTVAEARRYARIVGVDLGAGRAAQPSNDRTTHA